MSPGWRCFGWRPAAVAEAKKRNWKMNVATADSAGNLVAFQPQLIGRNRALEVLLSSEDIRGDQAEAYGYVNRALPDADLDAFRGARDPDRRVRQMGDRQYHAPRQHQLAAGRRTRRRVGCVHRFARATRRRGCNQSADVPRLPKVWGCRKSARTLRRPNREVGIQRLNRDAQTKWPAKNLTAAVPGR
jgi:hypothetical protein